MHDRSYEKPFDCLFCGSSTWVDPSDQSPPADYCHDDDHGAPPSRDERMADNLREACDA